MNNVRVTYSGLIAFVVALSSVFTGLIFTTIVTRQLSVEEFGTWSLIGNIITYFIIGEGIITYWTVRQIARGEKIGRTTVYSSIVYSILCIPIFLVIVFVIADTSNAILSSMILATVLVPVYVINKGITAINLGTKPQVISYGIIAFEISKIPAGLSFVYFLQMGLDGAIFALLIANILKISIQVFLTREDIRNRFNLDVVKRWLKNSWVSIYSTFPDILQWLDILLYPIITGSIVGLAFFSVSNTIAFLTYHSNLISQGLYSKLLGGGKSRHMQENFALLLYFAIPLLTTSIIFSKPILFLLNPIYQESSFVVILLAFKTFFFTLGLTLQTSLLAIEKIDLKENSTFSELAKSKLIFIPTIRYIKLGIYLAVLIILLVLFSSKNLPESELVTIWAALSLIVEVPFFIFIVFLTKKHIQFKFPISNFLKYLFASLGLASIYFLTSNYLIIYDDSIFKFLPPLLLQLTLCAAVYLGITYIIDKKTRQLFKSVIYELRK